jgi:Second Messenger Oligonucleotide or Dinucleotide Synthetase domain
VNETEAFDKFDDKLKLDPAERLRAETCHNEITLLLQSKGLITSAFLQGSFARKTMIAPLRDIDKVVILAESLRALSPDEVMDRLEDALHVAHPKATFDRTRHSLKIDFGNDSFRFDVVPAWETFTDDDDVLIANRDTAGWGRSNTRELMRVVAERNEDCNGRFIHVVRMIKHLVAYGMDEVIPGLHVESIAYAAVQTPMPYPKASVAVVDAATQLLGNHYTEPTGEDRISDRLTDNERALAQNAFSAAAVKAREARALAEAGDHTNAIRVWRELFGEPFPAPEGQSLGAALAAAVGGSVTSTGHVSSTTAARQSAPPTRSWRSS